MQTWAPLLGQKLHFNSPHPQLANSALKSESIPEKYKLLAFRALIKVTTELQSRTNINLFFGALFYIIL